MLLVRRVGQRHAGFAGGAEEFHRHLLVRLELSRRSGAARRRIGLLRWWRLLRANRGGQEHRQNGSRQQHLVHAHGSLLVDRRTFERWNPGTWDTWKHWNIGTLEHWNIEPSQFMNPYAYVQYFETFRRYR